MHDDGRGALLRGQLECAGEVHAHLVGERREQAQHVGVLLDVGTGRVAPRIAAPLIGAQAQFTLDTRVHQIRHALGGLNSKAMGEVGLGVLLLRLKAVEVLGGFLPNGDRLQGDDVTHAALDGSQVVGQTQQAALVLAGEVKACGLLARVGVKHHHVVAVAVGREVAIGATRHDPAVGDGRLLHCRSAR